MIDNGAVEGVGFVIQKFNCCLIAVGGFQMSSAVVPIAELLEHKKDLHMLP